jgi:anti-sigma factor RsiW
VNPSHAQPLSDEDLVAYLDGELEGEAARRVEERLRNDESVQGQLRRLEQAWEALDTLPRSEADEALTRSTVEMLAIEVEEQVGQDAAAKTQRRAWSWAGAAAGLFAAGFLGVLAGEKLWPDPDVPLLRDLPVVQDLDLYRQADNIEFLQQLRSRELFVKDAEPERAPLDRTP